MRGQTSHREKRGDKERLRRESVYAHRCASSFSRLLVDLLFDSCDALVAVSLRGEKFGNRTAIGWRMLTTGHHLVALTKQAHSANGLSAPIKLTARDPAFGRSPEQ